MKTCSVDRLSEGSSFVDTPRFRTSADSTLETLRVVLAYDDFPAGHRALQSLAKRVGDEHITPKAKISFWTFEMLEDAVQNAAAATEAKQADLIVCSTSGASSMSPGVDHLVAQVLGSSGRGNCEILALFGSEEAWSISLEETCHAAPTVAA